MTPPTPPKPLVWLGWFTAIMLTGMVWTLLTWPEGTPTGTVGFWTRLLVLPAFAWCLLFGFRLLYHEQESERIEAEEAALGADRANALRFAQEPLAVLATGYVCALGGGDVAAKIVDGEGKLASATASDGMSVRHTALDVPGFTHEERFRSCFTLLLDKLAGALNTVPQRVPLAVYLQLPPEADTVRIVDLWRACWTAAGHRPADPVLLRPERGIMALDAWLDVRGGPELEKVALFIAVQLDDVPQADRGEAAVVLLLGWAPLAERHGMAAQARVHRPAEAVDDDAHDVVSQALLWGNPNAAELGCVWQAGVAHADRPALARASSGLSLGLTQDIDAAIGDAGVAAPWLALALAIEHASRTKTAQLMVSRQNTLRAAVIQPVAADNDAEQQL